MRRLLPLLLLPLALAPAACGGGASSSGEGTSGQAAEAGEAGEVLTWGDGEYGVVLAHGAAFDAASWEDQATAIADAGASVVAVEDTSTEALAAAVGDLQDGGAERVALMGGSAGADSILDLASEQPDLADQLILLSPNSVVEGLGSQSALLVSSEDEPGADVPGDLVEANPDLDADVLSVPGDAHAQNVFDTDQGQVVLDAVLERIPA